MCSRYVDEIIIRFYSRSLLPESWDVPKAFLDLLVPVICTDDDDDDGEISATCESNST